MKQKRRVSMIGMSVVFLSALFMMTGCNDKPYEAPEYIKEDIVLKFKNESGKECYVEIKGESSSYSVDSSWSRYFSFPTVLKTKIPSDGTEKTITVKEVVVSGKTSKKSYPYNPEFAVYVIPKDTGDTGKWKIFRSESKTQYTEGVFHIKSKGNTFEIDYAN